MTRRDTIFLSLILVMAAILLQVVHVLIFHDAHQTLSYLLSEIAFVPLEVLFFTIIVDRLLVAREAARIMRAQGDGGAMVMLSSKSGLDASRANSAYNATKAGELHMMRGWALELGADGIRVNALAPGNVFEGSKIWNPEYINAAARKKGIKPEEVIPYYVSLTALKRDIKRSDVVAAVVFLCSDAARCTTGQTLVVDSGQVMVR